ncbi:transcriptional regulator, LysR family [Escherichia coli TA206]|uniref:LysR family transcriptional regulator n=1 Tax=Escherichia coli TaxID=562 RepID=UPI0001E8AA59|nr:LysR family transcriptional regulator [Escherichia coli]EGI25805.1 transcriptional regulator, LysR family [Escherichia coli TA206]
MMSFIFYMNQLAAIRTFISTVKCRSFSSAAKLLKIEASTASRHISELEEYLNITLFIRSTRGLTLTESGQYFYQHARQLLLQWEEICLLTSNRDKGPSGLIRMSVPATFGRLHIMPFIKEFLSLYPDISLDIMFSDEIQDLTETGIDLSIRTGILTDSSIHARKLASQTRRAWATPEWIKNNGPLISPDEYTEYPAVMEIINFSRLQSAGWYIRKTGSGDDWHRIPVSYRLSVSDSDALLYACCHHAGIAILPDWLSCEEARKGNIIRIFPEWEFSMSPGENAIWILYPQKRAMPYRIRAFIDFIIKKTGPRPYWDLS